MYLLRRVTVRAVSLQPSRQLSTPRPGTRVTILRPPVLRSFHQSRLWLAEEDSKRVEASPAEAETSGETVTTEPSAAEEDLREESMLSSEITDAASQTFQQPESAQDSMTEASGTAQSVASSARSAYDRTASNLQNSRPDYASRHRNQDTPRDRNQFPPRVPNPPSRILYIGNLFFEVTAPQLESEFSRFGSIANSRVVTDSRGLSKGFAYVEFRDQESADQAVRELDQKVFQGRRMAVQYHVRREPRGVERSTRQANAPSKTLFIGNMSYQMSDKDLNDLFREIRNVLDVRVAIDRRSGQPRGFAHADFIDVGAAERAKEHLEKKVIYGRQLKVDFSSSSSSTRQDRDRGDREGGETGGGEMY